jgi:hypothetical protein
MNRTGPRTALVVGLLATGVALGVPLAAGATASERGRTVRTTATGTATGVPDTATVALGVDSRGETATAALADNARKTRAVIDGMLFVGVKRRDIQTSGVNVYPNFDREGRIDGYTVSTRMTAKADGMDKAGAVIDAGAKLAGDDIRVDAVTLSIEDTSALVSEARARAVRLARRQAGELADAAGADLGRVRSIVERVDRAAGPFPVAADRAGALDESVPVEAGTQEIALRVTVVYELA